MAQTGPRVSSVERWVPQSPSQENLSQKPKGYQIINSTTNKQVKRSAINASGDFQNNERLTPLKKEQSLRKTIGPKREASQGNNSLMQPRILSKTNKNSQAASKELLQNARPSASNVVQGTGGQ